MEFIDQYLNLAADLHDFSEGRIGEDDILERYFTDPPDPRLRVVLHNIGQFLDDHRRRLEDEDYREMQQREMQKMIHLLRLGLVAEAGKITFLYESDTEY